MALTLRALHIDKTEKQVEIQQIDFVKFEAHFGISWNSATKDLSNTQLLWLAWTNQVRTNQTALEFEAWVETIADLEFAAPAKK